jgi:glutaredoxin
MKKITMVTAPDCPYCKKAEYLIRRIASKEPKYGQIKVEEIDADEAEARSLRYSLLPAIFIESENVFEGCLTIDILAGIMDVAIKSPAGK